MIGIVAGAPKIRQLIGVNKRTCRVYSPHTGTTQLEEIKMRATTKMGAKTSWVAAAEIALFLCMPGASQAEASGVSKHASKHYVLPATADNVQWGWYDINEKPRLTIRSGDTVSIETLSHSLGQIKPGVSMEEIVRLRKANPAAINAIGARFPVASVSVRVRKPGVAWAEWTSATSER